MEKEHKFDYRWTLKDARFTKDKGKVFSCFACGGGSTMGYKLAGFDVIGCNEIDPRMNEVYVANHHPRFNYLEPIQTFKERKDLPEELYNLDVLDGSPPCSSFSMGGVNGGREKKWGKEKKFREGQALQVLDTLFFDFIDLAKELQPKVVIAENVKGLLLGDAIKYVQKIYDEFDKAGYYTQHFLLDAQTMGVPQKRERVFFLCLRKDLAEPFLEQVDLFRRIPQIEVSFDEPPIFYGEFADYQGKPITSEKLREYWENRQPTDDGLGDVTLRICGIEKCFNYRFNKKDEVCHTLPARTVNMAYDAPVFMSDMECCNISTFPQDYNFLDQGANYICGMSVPPVMMAQVASRVYDQWLSHIPHPTPQ